MMEREVDRLSIEGSFDVRWLARMLPGRNKELQHPILGKIVLFPAKSGAYWEAEPLLNGERFSVAFETAGDAPPYVISA